MHDKLDLAALIGGYWFNSDYFSMVIWAFKKYFQMPVGLLGPNYIVHGV